MSTNTPTSTLPPTIKDLPPNKPLIFTNLLRFHTTAQYTTPPPANLPAPSPCPGSTAYWTRYFPIYHRACTETLGADANTLQRVLYKGAPLVPLRLSTTGAGGEEGYWHAVVVTRVEGWEVAERVGTHEEYRIVAGWHRSAAVEDDALFVSCPVDGFEMGELV